MESYTRMFWTGYKQAWLPFYQPHPLFFLLSPLQFLPFLYVCFESAIAVAWPLAYTHPLLHLSHRKSAPCKRRPAKIFLNLLFYFTSHQLVYFVVEGYSTYPCCLFLFLLLCFPFFFFKLSSLRFLSFLKYYFWISRGDTTGGIQGFFLILFYSFDQFWMVCNSARKTCKKKYATRTRVIIDCVVDWEDWIEDDVSSLQESPFVQFMHNEPTQRRFKHSRHGNCN